jgi:peptidoglycan hydrolase CwlO-like protein
MERPVSLYVIYEPLDMELVGRLVKTLMSKGLRVNYDLRLPESTDIRGEAMEKRMEIVNVDHILILFTRNSVSSELFSWDVGFALEMAGRPEVSRNIIPVAYGEEGLAKGLDNRLAAYQPVLWKDNIKGGFENAINGIFEVIGRFSNREYTQNITSKVTDQETLVVHDYQPFYLTEGDFRKTEDQLDFENDINSFASVIALRAVTPPLAIGLFGNWGSGKSFFMEKLSEKIEELTKPDYPDYVDNVVHVKFNSWHYSDANLWASMITEIFESLHDFATQRKYGPDAVKQIYQQLNITNQQLEETQKKIDEHDAREKEISLQKNDLEEEIRKKKEQLKDWKPQNYLNVAMSDPAILGDFQKIKDQFNEEELIDNIDQISEKVARFESEWSKLVEAFSLLKKMRKGNWKWIWMLAIIIIITTVVVTIPLVKDFISQYINLAVVYTGLVLTWLGNFIAKISPWYEKVRQFYLRLRSLKNAVDKEQDNIKLKDQEELARMNQEIIELNARKAELESEQQRISQKKSTLEDELKDIGSGKRLADFLATKTTDDLYQNQLGIISWIRRDFKKLNDLFRQQESANEEDKKVQISVKIDRIVLYIDDLDRCNEEVVVKVLEAIHLLLAFPLFVVIVGVDPRWLNNALSEKYRTLFGSSGNLAPGKDIEQTRPGMSQDSPLLTGIATSYDYLEKIFQIPFALKPINKTGREKLIAYLMKDEMRQETEPSVNQADQGQDAGGDTHQIQPLSPPAAPTEQQKQEEARRVRDKLEFTKKEKEYMQRISFLFGRTPRSINRYINIYRIIKAHGSMKITGDFSEDEYVPIMFILGVIVGYSAYAEEFIAAIARSDDMDSFKDFMDKSSLNQKLKDEIIKLSTDVEGILMKDFKRNLDLISRFSFRTLISA